MKARSRAIAVWRDERPLRLLVVCGVAFIFVLAQSLFAAHASSGTDDLKGHSAAECAFCLSGGVADDPAKALPAVMAPTHRAEAVKTAIPAALLTEITVRAASPRAPPAR